MNSSFLNESTQFQPPAHPLYTPARAVLVDIDDTMLDSEAGHMARSWNALLAPWGIVWKQFGDSDSTLRSIQESERPGVGIRPLEVVKHFMTNIERLDMSPLQADAALIHRLGVSPEDFNSIRSRWINMPQDMRIDEWARMLEKARGGLGLQLIREYGVKEIPGATDMVRRIHDSGYKVAFVTQAGLPMAREILYRLGLIHRLPNGDYTGDYEVLVTGDMVEKPKPDPEPHRKMEDLMRGLWQTNPTAIAMFGDSGSDVNFAVNLDLQRAFILKSEYLSPEKMMQMSAKLGPRLMFVPTWEGFDAVKHLDEMTTSLEGGGHRSGERK